jgi:hypothetical protein
MWCGIGRRLQSPGVFPTSLDDGLRGADVGTHTVTTAAALPIRHPSEGSHMAKHLLIALTNSVDGRDDEFNEWYTNDQLPQVVALDGFAAAQRFRLIPDEISEGAPYRYLAIYELDDNGHETAKASLTKSRSAGMTVSPAFDRSSVAAWYFEAISDRVSEEDD